MTRTRFTHVPHPTNRVWPGTPDHVMPTLEESYADGYETGLTWPNKDGWRHVPGGPWVHGSLERCNCHGDVRFGALIEHNRRVNQEWLRGWHAGFNRKWRNNPPEWYAFCNHGLPSLSM